MPDLTKFSQIQTTIDYWVEKYGGEKLVEVKEVSMFSHGGLNGPIIYLAYKFDNMADLIPFPSNGEKRNQLVIATWQKINFYWGKNARFNVMGCQTSMHPKYDFAKVMSSSSNCKDVIVSGQPS